MKGKKTSFTTTSFRSLVILKYLPSLKEHLYTSFVVGKYVMPKAKERAPNPAEGIPFDTGEFL